MGTDLTPGHTYTDGDFASGPSLTEHVSEAIIKPSFISAKNTRSPLVLTDEFVVRDTVADALRKGTLTDLLALLVGAGSVIQTQYAEYLANSNLTVILPLDDTIPQNTEGTQVIQATITPMFTTSRILVRFQGVISSSAVGTHSAALFRDAAAPALCATVVSVDVANYRRIISFEYLDSPSSTSALTYKVRVGPSAAVTVRMNGSSVARDFGGVARTTLTLQEIK